MDWDSINVDSNFALVQHEKWVASLSSITYYYSCRVAYICVQEELDINVKKTELEDAEL